MGMGDRFRAAFGLKPRPMPVTAAAPRRLMFAAESPVVLPVDQLLQHMWNRLGVIGRTEALTVPAVLRGRNMICAISTLPLEAVDEQNRVLPRPLFAQLDRNTANVVVLAQTLEDLLFDAVAWWRVVGFDDEGMPSSVQRYAPEQVSLQPPADYQRGMLPSGLATEGVVWMEGKPVPFDEVIRFDSPNPGLLDASAETVKTVLALMHAMRLYASSPRRRGYFTPNDGVDPAEDDAIEAALTSWAEASAERVDGYVPAALTYNAIQDSTPAELQLIQMLKEAKLDLVNAIGIDPEDVGINTTSRTYQNATDRRQDRINETLAPFMRAITDRLAMPDVTRPGVRVRFGLSDYLKADPRTRADVHAIYAGLGVVDASDIRQTEGYPARRITAPAGADVHPVQTPRRVPSTTAAALDAAPDHQFDADPVELTFADQAVTAIDGRRRTITGLLVPWGQYARSNGRYWRFERGAITWSDVRRVKLLRDHNNASAMGRALNLWEDDRGLWGTFSVSPGRLGDEALALAADGVLDGLSVGVDFQPEDTTPDATRPGAHAVHRAVMRESSLTAVPAFDDSRLTSVMAARQEGTGMPDLDTTPAPQPDPTPTPTPAPAPEPAPEAVAPVTFSADQFATFLETFQRGPAPAARPVVDPTQAARPVATTTVTEALPYRFSFDAGKTTFSASAEHDFSSDLIDVVKGSAERRDVSAPLERVNSLIKAAFADVERADVTALNPNINRPDMWVRQRDYRTVLWDMIAAGTTNGRKFDVPKFNSASGLVGPATEKVEPAAGSFVAELQTITPTQVWGKVEITRQAWRDGGSPQLSGILWDQMLREYYEDREAAVATFLNTLTAAADITLAGTPLTTPDNDDDQLTTQQLEAAIAMLQFDRGGDQISAFAVHRDLYRVLARVTDDAGRPLYPITNPSNANGSAQPRFRTMNIAGVTAVGSYALGASGTAPTNSWLFDPATVFGWASAPERLFWDFGATVQTANIPQLSFVTLGIYGDIALANTDIAGVRQVIFDPSI